MNGKEEVTISEELEDEYVAKVQEVIDVICGEDVELWKLLNPNMILVTEKKRLSKQEKINGAFRRKIELMQEFIDGRRRKEV